MWELVSLEVAPGDMVIWEVANGGSVLTFCATLELAGREARMLGLHVQGAGANSVGPAALLSLVRWIKDRLDVDILRVEGATRTTGAGPDRRPAPIDFR